MLSSPSTVEYNLTFPSRPHDTVLVVLAFPCLCSSQRGWSLKSPCPIVKEGCPVTSQPHASQALMHFGSSQVVPVYFVVFTSVPICLPDPIRGTTNAGPVRSRPELTGLQRSELSLRCCRGPDHDLDWDGALPRDRVRPLRTRARALRPRPPPLLRG
eukprot:763806-Rhodomonas_salina.2